MDPDNRPFAPDPNGPRPTTPEWDRPRQWLAYVPWARGEGPAAAAAASGYSKNYVQALASKWRKRYDISRINPKAVGLTPEVAEAGRQEGQATTHLKWLVHRGQVADEIAGDIESLRGLIGKAARSIAGDKKRLAELTPKDLLDLASAMEVMARTADRMAGIVEPGRYGGGGLPTGHEPDDPGVDEELLGDLLADGGTPDDLMDAIGTIAAGFLAETKPGEIHEHVLDVDSTAVAG